MLWSVVRVVRMLRRVLWDIPSSGLNILLLLTILRISMMTR